MGGAGKGGEEEEEEEEEEVVVVVEKEEEEKTGTKECLWGGRVVRGRVVWGRGW